MSKALFISMGGSAPGWYRCGLPANALQQDWAGMVKGPPGEGGVLIAGNMAEYPIPSNYSVIVVQQVRGDEWMQTINEWQSQGIKVIYEIDDFVQGVKRVKGHTFQKNYPKRICKEIQATMGMCDALIVSTDRLKKEYEKYNSNIFVCKNGIDTRRYDNPLPERDTINVGWSGGTGHHLAAGPWLEQVSKVMDELGNKVNFVSIGTRYADALAERQQGRTISIPWVSIENYPHALTNFDIAIAPAHESKYHLCKSDLRWLEASAVGIPTVGDIRLYPDAARTIENTSEVYEAIYELIDEAALRKTLGLASKKKVQEERDISVTSKQWLEVFNEVV